MLTVLLLMCFGIITGWVFHSKERLLKLTGHLTSWAIFLLLFLLGLSVGTTTNKIGFQAIALTVFAVAGSILLAWLTYHLFFKKR